MIAYSPPPGIIDFLNRAKEEMNSIGIKIDYDSNRIYGRGRYSDLVFCRVIISLFLRKKGLTYNMIGVYLGKDHSSILHYRDRWSPPPEFKEKYYHWKGIIDSYNIQPSGIDEIIEWHQKEIQRLTELKEKNGQG